MHSLTDITRLIIPAILCFQTKSTSTLHLASFPKDNVDEMLKFIKKEADIYSDHENPIHLFVTGLGMGPVRDYIQEKLSIRFVNREMCNELRRLENA